MPRGVGAGAYMYYVYYWSIFAYILKEFLVVLFAVLAFRDDDFIIIIIISVFTF